MPIEPLHWQRISQQYEHFRAVTGPGFVGESWLIGAPKPTVEISYRAPFPGNPATQDAAWAAYQTASARMNEIDTSHEEWWRLYSYGHEQELGWAANFEQATDVIERLRNGSDGLPSAAETLLKVFEVYDLSFEARKPGTHDFVLRLPKGSIHVHMTDTSEEQSISCRYDPANSQFFHYLLSLHGRRPSHDSTSTCFRYYPEGCDFLKVTAAHVVEVIVPWVQTNRMDRLMPRRRRK